MRAAASRVQRTESWRCPVVFLEWIRLSRVSGGRASLRSSSRRFMKCWCRGCGLGMWFDNPQPRVSGGGHGDRGTLALEQGGRRWADGVPGETDQRLSHAGAPCRTGPPSRRPAPADPRAVDAGRLLRVRGAQRAAPESGRVCVDTPAADTADSDPVGRRRSRCRTSQDCSVRNLLRV